MYAMNIQNDVIGLVLRENCKSKQMIDFTAWTSRCHDTILFFKENQIYVLSLVQLENGHREGEGQERN